MLVTRDVLKSYLIHVIDRDSESDCSGDVWRACFELCGEGVVSSLFKCDRSYHIAAALIGRHRVEQVRFSIQSSNASRPEELMTGERIEIAIEFLHVYLHMWRR